jgi:hypothetical protein
VSIKFASPTHQHDLMVEGGCLWRVETHHQKINISFPYMENKRSCFFSPNFRIRRYSGSGRIRIRIRISIRIRIRGVYVPRPYPYPYPPPYGDI